MAEQRSLGSKTRLVTPRGLPLLSGAPSPMTAWSTVHHITIRIQKGEDVDPGEYYFRTTPVFETGSEKYSWLNKIIALGVGALAPARVRYKVYEIV